MSKILQQKKIINSKRQPKNLKQFLSSSKFDYTNSPPTIQKCTDKRCRTCPDLIEGTSVVFNNGKKFTVKQNMSCGTKNVVYALICTTCGDFYIGETKT